tara:strand:+ start:251 stop:466 length:216 start_codon:yes stop_codon:yes gene_type:complete
LEGKAGTVVRQGCELRKKESEYAKEYSAQKGHYRKTYQILPPSELIMIRHQNINKTWCRGRLIGFPHSGHV